MWQNSRNEALKDGRDYPELQMEVKHLALAQANVTCHYNIVVFSENDNFDLKK